MRFNFFRSNHRSSRENLSTRRTQPARLRFDVLEDRVTPSATAISVIDPSLLPNSGAMGSFRENSGQQAVSPDGRYVAFSSVAANLVPGDLNCLSDVFVRDTLLGTTTLVSADSHGCQGDGNSYNPSLAFDGNGHLLVAFDSWSGNLVSGDTNGAPDVFVKDLTTNVVTRVSTDSAGVQSVYSEGQIAKGAFTPSIAVDGGGHVFVAFQSYGASLVPNDLNGGSDIFVKNLSTNATTIVSTASDGTQGNSHSYNPSLAIDASGHLFVAFESFANTLVPGDTNQSWDIFVKDLSSNVLTRVSTDSSGNQEQVGGHSANASLAIGGDGHLLVAFTSLATNLTADANPAGHDIFLKDLATNATTLVSTDSGGAQGHGDSISPSLRVDGAGRVLVAFQSDAPDLVSGDTNNRSDIFVKDLGSNVTTRLSTTTGGGQSTNNSASPALAIDAGEHIFVAFEADDGNLVAGDFNGYSDVFLKNASSNATSLISQRDATIPVFAGGIYGSHLSISRDGRYVAFTSNAGNLVPGDVNGSYDVFVRDTLLGTTTLVSTDSSGNQGNASSLEPSLAVDDSGHVFVAFTSYASNLVPGDANGDRDIFVKNLSTNATTCVSVKASGTPSDGVSIGPSLAVDPSGHVFVAFASKRRQSDGRRHERFLRRLRSRPDQQHDDARQHRDRRRSGRQRFVQPVARGGQQRPRFRRLPERLRQLGRRR